MTDRTGGENAETNENPPQADAQPTQAYPPSAATPADAQPTQAYPPAAYPPAAYPAAPQEPAVAPPGYGAPGGYPAGTAVATAAQPKGLAITALVLGIVGVLIALLGFIPLAGIGFAVVGGIVLLAGLIVAIIAVASKKQGGRSMSITGLVLSIVGLVLGTLALVFQFVFIAAVVNHANTSAQGDTSQVAPLESASPEPTPGETSVSGSYDEQAYLAAVRPELVAVMQKIVPGATAEQLNAAYSDEQLLQLGKAIAGTSGASRDVVRTTVVKVFVEGGDGKISEEQAGQFFDAIAGPADEYLKK